MTQKMKLNSKAHYMPKFGQPSTLVDARSFWKVNIVVDQVGNGFLANFHDIFSFPFVPDKNDRWQDINMYPSQLGFAVWLATTGSGISTYHLYHKDPMIQSVYLFHVYLQTRLILKQLEVALPNEPSFNARENKYNPTQFKLLSAEFNIPADKFLWPYPTRIQRSRDTWKFYIQNAVDGLSKAGVQRLSQSIRFYTYLLLESQASARSSIVGNSARSFDAQKIFSTAVEKVIRENISLSQEIARFQNVLKYARSQPDFGVAIGTYLIPSDLKLGGVNNIHNFSNELTVANHIGKLSQPHSIKPPSPLGGFQGNRVTTFLPEQKESTPTKSAAVQHEEEKQALLTLGIGLISLLYLLK